MDRLDKESVLLTPWEMKALSFFDHMLNLGRSIPQAVEHVKLDFPGLSDEFLEYLAA